VGNLGREKMRWLITLGAVMCGFTIAAAAQDPGWPRVFKRDGAALVVYQPQVDNWNNFADLNFRFAFTLTPAAGKHFPGVAVLHGATVVNPESDQVTINALTITSLNFPSSDPPSTAQMDQLFRAFLPPSVNVSLRRLVACSPKKGTTPAIELRSDPPAIFVSDRPAILLYVDAQPRNAPIPKTKLEFVVNTTWPLFLDSKNSEYYLLVSKQWMTASALQGPWTPTYNLPREMEKLPNDTQWASLKKAIPPPRATSAPVPTVFFSLVPAEVIIFNGPPNYAPVPGTQLTYAVNTTSNVFFYNPMQQFYYLTAGRWFSASSLQGPWTYATPFLPSDFGRIPPTSPAGRVLVSVPGTEEAKDAVLLAQVPKTLVVNPAAAAAQIQITYYGLPEFAPIQGTTLFYATNTQDKVIQVGNAYYLCLQGIWFTSESPSGPWSTAAYVPQAIYTIPPGSPVYNVTYVTQTVTSTGNIQASYTAGYLGGFITGTVFGAVVCSGTGYYYPAYVGVAVYGGYPAYVAHAGTYGVYAATGYTTARGAYGVTGTVYGAYGGSATGFAQYNPYTGTYARGASWSTPYGSGSAVQTYNPYTGTYAAHASSSGPYSQWGSSVVSGSVGTAYAQHISTAQGTAGAVETSAGGRGIGVSTANGDTRAVQTANGDLYAGHDGNVYRNTGNGWQQYQNGNWNNIHNPYSSNSSQAEQSVQERSAAGREASGGAGSAQSAARGGGSSAESGANGGDSGGVRGDEAKQGLNEELQNRQRGTQSSRRFNQSQGGFGGRGLAGFHGRGR
jgi:hypothetical protein